MNELGKKVIAGAVRGFVVAFVVDLQKYAAFRKADPSAKYDWVVAGISWVIGGFLGAAEAVGLSGAADALGVA